MSRDLPLMLIAVLAPPALYLAVPWAAARLAVARAAGTGVVNYRGARVPLGLGWAWFAWGVAAVLPALISPVRPGGQTDIGVLVAGVALLGWLDDRHGTSAARGFRGHLAALRRGRVTTGLLKLGGIAGLALAVAWGLAGVRTGAVPGDPGRIAVWLLCAAVIAMTANLVNLLDLRPGRALKAYVVIALPAYLPLGLAAVRPGWHWTPWLALMVASGSLLVLGPALACWSADVGERAMLGDMGANAAGALAGWLLARVLPLPALALAAAVLLALNVASERISFTSVIESARVLRWLDRLGRPLGADGDVEPGEGDGGP